MERSEPSAGPAEVRLHGAIEGFDPASGAGVIVGPGQTRYRFAVADLAPGLVPAAWQRVEFAAGEEGRAIAITNSGARSGSKIDLGRVVQRTFTTIGRHWVLYFGAAAILVGVPSAVAAWGQQAMALGFSTPVVLAFGLGSLGYLVGAWLIVGFTARSTINGYLGKPIALRESLSLGFKVALPLSGLAMLATLGIVAGAFVFLIPALVLCVWWSVAGPALVIEREGISASLGRSNDLTEGYRWQIFGLLVAFVLLSTVSFAALTALAAAIFGGLPDGGGVAVILSDAVSSVVTDVVAAAGSIALYHELRTAKEGHGTENLAAVFD